MKSSASPPVGSPVDLCLPAPLARHSRVLERTAVDRSWAGVVEALAGDLRGTDRTRRLAEILGKLETKDAKDLLIAVGKSSLALETAGIRTLFSLLEVKPPGVEVLRQLETLSSLQRVALRMVAGTWAPPEEGESSAFPILEVLEEGMRNGVLDVGVERLPRRPSALLALFAHLRAWFLAARTQLELGNRLPENDIHYLTQLGMIEIHFLESRVSRLATRIDPYDTERMGRLLPVLARYDQDIDHMKQVTSRLVTYQPFFERLLTVEHAMTTEAMLKLQKHLAGTEATAGMAALLGSLRENPLLERRLAMYTAGLHRLGVLLSREGALPLPDLHSTLFRVLQADARQPRLRVRMNADLADAVWPTVEAWGLVRSAPDMIEVSYHEDRVGEFLEPDGTPRLPRGAEEDKVPLLSIKDLVRSQLQNDAFILGILENPRATSLPGVVELLAAQSRSLRVLDKICRTPALYNGPANKNVPAFLLRNPAHIPMTSLRRFIHVRFVSKVDLRLLARNAAGMRPEVIRELERYLATIKG